ncbi:alpha/beta fold hydrolase [Naumannella sp. ID2617S]|nr:alpha/beta fold hydrolase [Naumannella sp. ID2617S]
MTNLTIDPHAVLWREGGAELLVLMHGFGSNAADMFALAPHLPTWATVASLEAPTESPDGNRSWFEFNPAVDSTDHSRIDASAQAVLGWLEGLEQQPRAVHLLGFSQGAALAVQLARLAPQRFASVSHLSSFVHAGELPGDAELAAREPRLPLLQTIGTEDQVIAANKRERSIPWLDEHFAVERHHYRRGHAIADEELGDIVAFLNRVRSA